MIKLVKLTFANMQKNTISVEKILSLLKIQTLNPIQQASLKANESEADIILMADTGSGKTLAFLLPVLQLLDPEMEGTQAMVIVPSRELALQIEQVFKKMGTGFKVTCCYGGHKRETEENNLMEAPALIIGTPGRIADHIRRRNIQVTTIQTLVLDEFDKSLELGFEEEMSFILGSLPALKKRILTSATPNLDIPLFMKMSNPLHLDFLSGKLPEALTIEQVFSPDKDKADTLFQLICTLGNRSMIVFCNHRESVERISQFLKEKGILNVFYHGALEQPERDVAIFKFRNGTANVLVTTDLAARGLDIPNIRYIIHYHLPVNEDTFVHRNGRTARVDASGTAILILGPDEKLPEYLPPTTAVMVLSESTLLPEKPKWSTVFIGGGKKDKINKVDIVGFFTQRGQLKKEDIGLIEVKDYFSFVAIRKSKVGQVMELVKEQKMKNRKIKIAIAK